MNNWNRSVLVCLSLLFLFPFGSSATEKRITYSINKNDWRFIKKDVRNAYKTSFNDKEWLSVQIPHDFNGGSDGVNNDVFNGRFDFENDVRTMYKGPAWYRTNFTIEEAQKGKRIFIEFEAVSLEAQIWVNGKKAGIHRGGYSAFSLDITDLIKFGKDNTLAVRADNSNNPAIAPWMYDERGSFPFSFDYAVYGGIYRDVWIHVTDPVKIEQVFNTPVCGGQAPSVLSIETRVTNYSKSVKKVKLSSKIYSPDGKLMADKKMSKTIEAGAEMSFQQSESALGIIQFWSVDDPQLYKVISTLSYDGNEVNNFESTFGFRYYTLANHEAFSLNGEQMLLRGVNRHQDMEGLGYALPNEQHFADAQIIKDAGFNVVRHAHYPCDREFAKACDELGLMLWLEIPLTGSVSEDPAFMENCKQQMKEMIEQYYNNPSVIVWGVGNESDRSGASESESNKLYGELVDLAKRTDAIRPTTGCNFKFKSNQEIVDVYAPQDWSGWYVGQIDDYTPNSIIGEYGADMNYNTHSNEKFDMSKDYGSSGITDFWSQEYGCFLHEYKISKGESLKGEFPGHFVWVAFDFASPRIGRGMNPIPYMNQKGLILHDHKTKKDVYYLYQSMYRKASDYPMVYIVSKSWTDRFEKPGNKDVWAYSNCDSVVLYNDLKREVSFGTRMKNAGPRGDTRFQWDSIAVDQDVLYAEGWFGNKIVARDTIQLGKLPDLEK
ncbi:glycoside hydrolase family 2 protein [Labilibaculum antarcticum]|uniref:Beta-galactosidase n=1 Tax=Labilibaculum antarcticum TaxID=1717717 RepID=A0A1Y1CJ66_9BACT|nr:glycoside hydrolase family 2 TIM barrel-domain containing protein [Labilibaculum antarcticum]BAX80417.1 beta-galactosidase [Labilibaculum antarcticum]